MFLMDRYSTSMHEWSKPGVDIMPQIAAEHVVETAYLGMLSTRSYVRYRLWSCSGVAPITIQSSLYQYPSDEDHRSLQNARRKYKIPEAASAIRWKVQPLVRAVQRLRPWVCGERARAVAVEPCLFLATNSAHARKKKHRVCVYSLVTVRVQRALGLSRCVTFFAVYGRKHAEKGFAIPWR